MKKFKGENILEVWDFRLSRATPLITNVTGTWVVEIWAKVNPDYDPGKPNEISKPIESYDTGIATEPGDEHNCEKVKICYEWMMSVRDKYSLPNIEKIKPLVANVNAANAALANELSTHRGE